MTKNKINTFLKNKVVLVTGGTGSFGQYFVDTALTTNLKKLIVFSRDELKQSEMQARISDPRIRFFLGDVRDLSRLERAFAGVDIVIHAAALKQVPALEYNPLEAVKTNIFGTQNVIDAALNNDVHKVLLVSTDKAVNPVNLYGATKLCAEKLFIAANAYRKQADSSIFSSVRYGNVIGSRGSLLEILAKQRQKGKVTLTHKDMTRFWLRIEDAVELVMNALYHMRGGEVFVPKAPSMKVKDLITTVAPECVIETIGIRPGEKMHEALMTENEVHRTKDLKSFYIVQPDHKWWEGDHLKRYPLVPEDFVYVSNGKHSQLTKQDLKNLSLIH